MVVVVASGSSTVTVEINVAVTVGPSVTIWVTISVVVTSYPGPPSTGTTEYGTCLFSICCATAGGGDSGRAFDVNARDEIARTIAASLNCIAKMILSRRDRPV